MKTFHVTLIALLFVASVALSAWPSPRVGDDAAVLSTVLQDRCHAAKQDGEYIYQLGGPYWEGIISSATENSSASSLSNKIDPFTINSFNRRNTSPHKLPQITACENFKVVDASKFRPFYGWQWFTKEYPDAIGLFKLSLPGYSANHNLAIVRISETCSEGTCNATFYWILKRVHNKWVVASSIQP